MLHALQTPYDKYLHHAHRKRKRLTNPEIKHEHRPTTRLRFLDHSVPDRGTSLIVKTIVVVLAVYGLYSLIF